MLSFTYILFHVNCVIRYNSSWTSLMCCSQSWQALFFSFFFFPLLSKALAINFGHYHTFFSKSLFTSFQDCQGMVRYYLPCIVFSSVFFFFNLCRGDCSDCLSCLKQLPVWVLFLNKNTMHTRGKKKKRFPVISGIMQN